MLALTTMLALIAANKAELDSGGFPAKKVSPGPVDRAVVLGLKQLTTRRAYAIPTGHERLPNAVLSIIDGADSVAALGCHHHRGHVIQAYGFKAGRSPRPCGSAHHSSMF